MRVTHGIDFIKKICVMMREMVKLREIKDIPWGTFFIVKGTDHLQGNNHEILWAVCGRDYANLLGIGLMKCDAWRANYRVMGSCREYKGIVWRILNSIPISFLNVKKLFQTLSTKSQ